MERRKLIVVGIKGDLPASEIPAGALWLAHKKGCGSLLFGLPKRGEDDSERALRFAASKRDTAIRMSVKELDVRWDGKIPHLDWEKEFAAEFQDLNPGEILVSPALASLFERLYLFEKLEDRGSEAFFMRGARLRPARLRGVKAALTPLVGREKELEFFEDLLDQISMDQGQVVSVVGEPGMGKSRLVIAFRELLAKKEVPFVYGAFAIHDEDKPFRSMRDVLSHLMKMAHESDSIAAIEEVESDFLRHFIDPAATGDRFAHLTEEQIQQGIFHAVRKLLHMCARNPLVVILEDLHWADRHSLDLLHYCMDGMETTRLLLVLAYRSDLEGPWRNRLNWNEMSVQPFGEDEMARFVAISMDVDRVAPNVHRELFRLSHGNPLFVEEVLRKLLDAGHLQIETSDDGRKTLRAEGGQVEEIPTTLRSLITSRLDRLEHNAREVLRWAVLLGPSFEMKELAGIVTQELSSEHEPLAAQLIEASYIVEESAFPRRIFRFQHDIVYEVVHEGLDDGDRRRRHAVIANFVEREYQNQLDEFVDRIADHHLQGEPGVAAIQWAKRAGDRNMRLYRYALAERYFRKALGIAQKLPVDTGQPMDPLFKRWVHVLLVLGNHEKARRALGEWSESTTAQSPRWQGTYFLLWAQLQRARSDYVRCLDSADRAIETLTESPELEEEHLHAIEHRMHALIHLGRGREVIHEGLSVLRKLGDKFPAARFRIWTRMAFEALHQGGVAQALEYLKKAERIADPSIGPADWIDFYIRYVAVVNESSDYVTSLGYINEAIRIATAAGMRARVVEGKWRRAQAYLSLGQFAKAREDLDDAARDAKLLNDRLMEAQITLSLAQWYLDVGGEEEAQKLIANVGMGTLNRLGTQARNERDLLLAQISLRQGKPKEAAALYRTVARRYEDIGHRSLYVQSLCRALWIEAVHELHPSENLKAQFHELHNDAKSLDLAHVRTELWATALGLAATGTDTGATHRESSEFETLWPLSRRQRAYLTNMRYLLAQGQTEKARELFQEYRKTREVASEQVPPEYRAAFLSHIEFDGRALFAPASV